MGFFSKLSLTPTSKAAQLAVVRIELPTFDDELAMKVIAQAFSKEGEGPCRVLGRPQESLIRRLVKSSTRVDKKAPKGSSSLLSQHFVRLEHLFYIIPRANFPTLLSKAHEILFTYHERTIVIREGAGRVELGLKFGSGTEPALSNVAYTVDVLDGAALLSFELKSSMRAKSMLIEQPEAVEDETLRVHVVCPAAEPSQTLSTVTDDQLVDRLAKALLPRMLHNAKYALSAQYSRWSLEEVQWGSESYEWRVEREYVLSGEWWKSRKRRDDTLSLIQLCMVLIIRPFFSADISASSVRADDLDQLLTEGLAKRSCIDLQFVSFQTMYLLQQVEMRWLDERGHKHVAGLYLRDQRTEEMYAKLRSKPDAWGMHSFPTMHKVVVMAFRQTFGQGFIVDYQDLDSRSADVPRAIYIVAGLDARSLATASSDFRISGKTDLSAKTHLGQPFPQEGNTVKWEPRSDQDCASAVAALTNHGKDAVCRISWYSPGETLLGAILVAFRVSPYQVQSRSVS